MAPVPHSSRDASLPRVITYYQTHHTRDGRPISILPILNQPGISVTHVILAALHINDEPANITLNDHHPSHPRFATLWAELRILQASGVKVLCMLGGAARGTYRKLDRDQATFERYWAPVRDLIRERGLDGIDLDVEEPMSIDGMVRLVDRVRTDFGRQSDSGFFVSLAPVAAAMLDPEKNLSGFDYEELELRKGEDIDFYNVQFYNGWGDAARPFMFDLMMAKGWSQRKLVLGLVTNPENGHGWVPWEALAAALLGLRARYPDFGGVMGWEYFNGLPAGRARPWEWARWMTRMLRAEHVAARQSAATTTAVNGGGGGSIQAGPVHQQRQETTNKKTGATVREADPDAAKGQSAPVPDAFDYYSDTAEAG